MANELWVNRSGGAPLPRRVGLGLAARGSVTDVVAWAEDARRAGLDSVWIHDSYFERDAVTYTAAIAAQVRDVRVALGALNPYTRDPVLPAMTVSVEYGRAAVTTARPSVAPQPALTPELPAHDHVSLAGTVARKAAAAYEIVRPFSFTASIVPVATAGALAALDQAFSWPLFLAALIGAVALQIGTNVVKEIYHVRKGIDIAPTERRGAPE